MIRFNESPEKKENTDITSSQAIIKIIPEYLSSQKAKNVWDNLFADITQCRTSDINEDICQEIFDRDPDEFRFDFPFDEEITNTLESFSLKKWSQLSVSEKLSAIDSFVDVLNNRLELEERPRIVFFDGDNDNLGAYIQGKNQIEINSILMDTPSELVNTLAHELRHAYQYEHALSPKNAIDELYAINFDNYISPGIDANGFYHSFFDYEDQLIEAEARAFASLFSSKEAE